MPRPDVVVYLDATAAVCHARIHGVRKRDCESGIPLAYLEGLDACYQTFLGDMAAQGSAVLQFDWRDYATCPAPAAVASQCAAAIPAPLDPLSPRSSSILSALVKSDASVLAALELLPPDCALALAALDGPDLAEASSSLAAEVKLSRSESLREEDQDENAPDSAADSAASDALSSGSSAGGSSDEEVPAALCGSPDSPTSVIAAKQAGAGEKGADKAVPKAIDLTVSPAKAPIN